MKNNLFRHISLFVLCFFLVVPNGKASAKFTDISGSEPYYPAIEILSQKNIIQGYADGRLRPDNSITSLWKLNTSDGNGESMVFYNPSQQQAFFIPWWNISYLYGHGGITSLGAPKSSYSFSQSTQTWDQVFEKGTIHYNTSTNTYGVN